MTEKHYPITLSFASPSQEAILDRKCQERTSRSSKHHRGPGEMQKNLSGDQPVDGVVKKKKKTAEQTGATQSG